jgi:hypothetical protein
MFRSASSKARSAPEPASDDLDFAAETGRRIRWERHPDDDELIIVYDALTGEVIAVVRSLFEISGL